MILHITSGKTNDAEVKVFSGMLTINQMLSQVFTCDTTRSWSTHSVRASESWHGMAWNS